MTAPSSSHQKAACVSQTPLKLPSSWVQPRETLVVGDWREGGKESQRIIHSSLLSEGVSTSICISHCTNISWQFYPGSSYLWVTSAHGICFNLAFAKCSSNPGKIMTASVVIPMFGSQPSGFLSTITCVTISCINDPSILNPWVFVCFLVRLWLTLNLCISYQYFNTSIKVLLSNQETQWNMHILYFHCY